MAKTMWNPLAATLEHNEFEAYHVITEGGFGMPAFHTHDHYEFYLYVMGNADITMEEKNYTPEPYALFIYPPGVMHRCTTHSDMGRYERAYAYSRVDFLRLISTEEFPMLEIIEKAMEKYIYGYRLGVKAGAKLVAQIDEIIRNEHLTESLTLDELAAKFYVSKYYLLHAFKEYANLSVHQYIISKRIIHAQILLQNGVSPGEAARDSGFNDYAGFYPAFVKQTGMTPQQYSRRESSGQQKNHPATYRMAMGTDIYLNAGSSSSVMK